MNELKSLLDRQHDLEAQMMSLGVQRYERGRPMPWKEGDHTVPARDESAMAPGASVVERNTDRIAAAIRTSLEAVYSGKAGRYARIVPDLLKDLEPEALANIALRKAIQGAAINEPLMNAMLALGSLVEEHRAISALFIEEKKLANWWERKAKVMGNAAQARRTMRHGAHDYLDQSAWTNSQKVAVGAFLLEIVEDLLGIITRTTVRKGKRVREVLTVTPAFREWLDQMHSKCSLLQPVRLPMVVPPLKWSTPWDGGYLTIASKIMKNASRAQIDDLASTDLRRVYDAVNTLQETRWAINKPVLDVLRLLRDAPAGAPCIPAGEDGPIPPRPSHIPVDLPISEMTPEDKETIGAWRKRAAAAHHDNAARLSKRVAFAQKVWVAETFASEAAMFYPMQIDTRGRIYTVPTEVGPQSDDLGKALVRFADRKPLGEAGAYWLAVHVANCAGVDKVTFDERVQWVLNYEDLILEIALCPADMVDQWSAMDSPWQFLAGCFEWAGYVLSGRSDAFASYLPVGMDGSCSGLQHFSAALRDHVGGTAVNLVPTGKVEDLYTEVATRVQVRLNASTCDEKLYTWRGKVDRKTVKQPCMTYAYSATVAGMRGQILVATEGKAEADRPEGDAYANALALAPVVRECIEETVVAAAGAMKWLQKMASLMTDLDKDLVWTSAIGLPVRQSERKIRERAVSVWYCGKRFEPKLQEHTEVLNKMGQRSAIAPNWVHSQDASHLMMVVNDMWELGVHDFAMIHDSFGVHACHVERLHVSIREKFIELYSVDRLAEFRDGVLDACPEGTDVPPLPPYGALRLDSVRDSEYFFA